MDREIRILLVGKACTGKSSLGNLLIGEKRFKVHRNGATKESQLERSRLFDGTELVIVDTPGYENLYLSKEETDMELLRGMGLLKPGPHFIIAVKSLTERVTGTDVEWMKQFQARYAQYMQNIIPVFTGTDALEDTEITLDKYIEDFPTELQQMLKAIGDIPLIGGRSNKNDRELVDEIFTRINTCYKPDNYIKLEVEAATPGPPGEHFGGNQKSCMMETVVHPLESQGWDQPSNHRNIILLGKSGIGKSSVGNILLDEKVFQTSFREDKGTKSCEIQTKEGLTVVDTPGYFSSLRSDTDTAQNIVQTLQLNNLPIHVFMLVFSADPRFSGDEKESLDFIKRLFGEKVVHNMIIVFTGKDQLEDFDIKFKEPDCLPSAHQFLINGKKLNAEVRREIWTEIWKSRYDKAVDILTIDRNTLSTIWTTENERKMGSKRRVEELSNTYQSHFNQHSKRRADELSPTPNSPFGNNNPRPLPLPSSSQPIGNPSRTWRKRQHKFVLNKLTRPIDRISIEENKRIGKWVTRLGMKKHRLQSRIFPETGRGMMALSTFTPGDILISLPLNLLITADTVLNSTLGHYVKSYNSKLSLHQALALFLLLEKTKGEDSAWWNYLQTIPKSFTTAGYFTEEECFKLPERLHNSIQIHNTKLRKDYRNCQKFCKTSSLCEKLFIDFKSFRWAWCAVNSRSVYYKSQSQHLEEKDCNMALAPFLDLLNHSTEAKSEARFNAVNQCYEITTGNTFKKYQQVFISYGPHDNEKLFLEYGFILPNNPNSVYPITQDQIVQLAHQQNIQNISHKLQILTDNNLLKNLTCSYEGVDWKLDKVFKILSCSWTELQNWKQIIIGTVIDDEIDHRAKKLSLVLLHKVLDKTLQQIQGLNSPAVNYHEEMCHSLLMEDLNILNTSIKLLL